jgi:hypothetical protein
MLDQIESTARGPDGKVNFGQFLGWGPRAKQASLDMLANIDPQSIPPDQREWFDRANDFRATVTAYKANEYHELFGGSQTATEIKNGASSILSEKMSEPAFNAAYRRLRQKTDRAMKVASMVLAENIPVGTPEYRKRFAELEQQRFGRSEWQGAGGDSGITREQQISKRMAEMRGVAPEVQIQNLKNEGLFTEQQAAEALQHIGGR